MDGQILAEPFPGARFLLAGEVRKGVWLLTGPPGGGKSLYCRQFARDGLGQQRPTVYLHTDEAPDDLMVTLTKLVQATGKTLENGLLRLVDCYSWRTGEPVRGTFAVQRPSNLTDVSITLEQARQGADGGRFVADSVSSLTLEAGEDQARRFLQIVVARIRAVGMTGLYVMEEGVHSAAFVNFLRFMMDGVLEIGLRDDPSGMLIRSFRIFSMRGVRHSTRWIPFSIFEGQLRFEAG